MEFLTTLALLPACFGLALLLQVGLLKLVLWALCSSTGQQ